MLKKVCKWFSQDVLWDIYLKSINAKSKCLNDSESSARDKIKYIYEVRDVSLGKIDEHKVTMLLPYALSEVNSYESRHNISIPIDVKCYIVEITRYIGLNVIDLDIVPTLRPDGMIEIKLGKGPYNDPFVPIDRELVIDKREAFIGICGTLYKFLAYASMITHLFPLIRVSY